MRCQWKMTGRSPVLSQAGNRELVRDLQNEGGIVKSFLLRPFRSTASSLIRGVIE
ncbi:hypothetical protein QNH46_19530 [Paenibacillus woosongensis]|uniref:Uncharacterized protein n=1 Tax=Paenibacillus woosongensis TaxID=307580 RepID=A0AA95I0I0_9BACL|nr:hypothetical protein [Paenibacillus woosongensis]WHX48269.1 hypothetical protein QNH46_19530 [Paenibacillus woosongensis]